MCVKLMTIIEQDGTIHVHHWCAWQMIGRTEAIHVYITWQMYHIAGNIGGELNLADWQENHQIKFHVTILKYYCNGRSRVNRQY